MSPTPDPAASSPAPLPDLSGLFTAPSPPLDAATLGDVAARFGLGPVETITRLGGVSTATTRLVGPGFDVVARTHRPWVPPGRLESVHAVQDRLAAAGLPVPVARSTPGGDRWSRVGRRLVELVDAVPGGEQAATPGDLTASAAMLGRVHAALATTVPATIVRPTYSLVADTRRSLALLGQTRRILGTLAARDPVIAATVDGAARTLAMIAAAEERWAAALPVRVTHGDFCGGNVLLRDGVVVAVLDFDRMDAGPCVRDLGFCLFHGAGRTLPDRWGLVPGHDDTDGDRIDGLTTHLGEWVAAYEAGAGAPLSTAERALLPAEMARATLFPVVSAGAGLAVTGETETVAELHRNAPAVCSAEAIMARARSVITALPG